MRFQAYIRNAHLDIKVLAIIFLVGLVLRLSGVYPGYPQIHPDEPTIQTTAQQIAFDLNFKPQGYYYGSFLSILYGLSYWLFFIPVTFALYSLYSLFKTYDLILNPFVLWDNYLEFILKPIRLDQLQFYNIPYWSRYDTAIISSLTIIAIFFLAKKLFNSRVALIAVFLTAINIRHVLSSILVLADAPVSFFIALSLLVFWRILEKPSLFNYLVSGIMIAMTLSVKYFIYIIPSFLFIHLLASFSNHFSLKQKLKTFFFSPKLYTAVLISALLFLTLNSYLILDYERAHSQLEYNALRYRLGFSVETLFQNNLSYYSLYYFLYVGLGPALSVFILLGLVICALKHPKKTLFLILPVLLYGYILLVISGTGLVRNYSSVLPLLFIFAGIFVSTVFEILAKYSKGFAYTAMVLILAVPVFSHLRADFNAISGFSEDNNIAVLHNWLDENVKEGSKILSPPGIFFPSKSFIVSNPPHISSKFLSLEEMKKEGPDFIILNFEPLGTINETILRTRALNKGFFNKQIFTDIASNSYLFLVFNELAQYRIKEFYKPGGYDANYLVIKFPKFWDIKKDDKIVSADFNLQQPNAEFYPVEQFKFEVIKDSQAILRIFKNPDNPKCDLGFYKLTLLKFPTIENKWYTLSTFTERRFDPALLDERIGFFRLDFYSDKNQLLKTLVTRPLSSTPGLQQLHAAGLAPSESSFAKIAFVINQTSDDVQCLYGEEFYIQNFEVFVSDFAPQIQDYQYFEETFAKPFDWDPPL